MSYRKLAAIAALVMPMYAHADDLAPGQGVEHIFGSTSVLTYYVTTTQGYHLIATMNNIDGDPTTVFRFSTTLNDGEEVMMSMPRAVGEKSKEVVFRRIGDRLAIENADELIADK